MLNRLINALAKIFKLKNNKPKILIFGASKGGQNAFHHLIREYSVMGFVDNNISMQGKKLLGKKVYAPDELNKLMFNKVIIASDYHVEIKSQLTDEYHIQSEKVMTFKLDTSIKKIITSNLSRSFDNAITAILCNISFITARCLSKLFSLINNNYHSRYLKKITWLDQLNTHKIKVFYPAKSELAYAPKVIGENNTSNLIFIPEVALYHFKKGVIMTSLNAVLFGDNKITIARIPSFSIKKSQFDGGFLMAHGTSNALIKGYQRETIDKGIAIVGSNDRNYYHWVIEVLSKFQFISELPEEYDEYPILISEQVLEIESIQEFISFFKICRKIIYLKSCLEYQVDNLLFISPINYFVANLRQGQHWSLASNFVRNNSLEYLRDSVFNELSFESISTPARVFLARKGIIRDYNQKEVHDLLRVYGFEAVYLEDLNLKQQVSLMKNAEVIVGPTGAAWTNLIFCSPGALALCWMAEEIGDFTCFSDLALFSQVKLEYIKYNVGSKSTRELYLADYKIDINKIKLWLIENKLNIVNDN